MHEMNNKKSEVKRIRQQVQATTHSAEPVKDFVLTDYP